MLRRLLHGKLREILDLFFDATDKEQVEVSVLGGLFEDGKVALRNLSVRQALLDELALPVRVVAGFVGRLERGRTGFTFRGIAARTNPRSRYGQDPSAKNG